MNTFSLHDAVVGPSTSLRYRPFDVLPWVLDAASLTVKAVLRIDVEHLVAGAVIIHILIHTSRAVSAEQTAVKASTKVH